MTLKESQLIRTKLAYWIRGRQPGGNGFFGIDSKNYKEAIQSIVLPNFSEQADLLIQVIGDEVSEKGSGLGVSVLANERCAMLGAKDPRDVSYLFKCLTREGLLELVDASTEFGAHRLTLEGWRTYEELKRGRVESRRAFMAMAYAPEHVRYAYENCFKAACKRTGYQLSIVPEISDTGSINNHIVVGIVNSKFVIVDHRQ